MENDPVRKTERPLLEHIGKALRAQFHGIVDEPLPNRWIDLINYLNERDREQRESLQRNPGPEISS